MDSQPWVPLILTASTRVPPPALPVPQPHLSELQGRVCPFWGPTPELAATLGFSFPQIPQPFLIVYPESECPPCPCLPGTNLDRGSGCPSASAQARDGVRPGGGLAGDSVLEGERGDLMRHHVGSSQKPENQSWRPAAWASWPVRSKHSSVCIGLSVLLAGAVEGPCGQAGTLQASGCELLTQPWVLGAGL